MPDMAPIAILKSFFGLLPGQTLKDFRDEVAALSPTEKSELVQLAATELNVTVKA